MTAIATELLRAESVVRHFPTRAGVIRALEGVSLVLHEGETLGIVGESGSGKSTLGRLLVGIDRPTTGEVVVGGVRLSSANAAARFRLTRFIQMVFQDPFASLNPRLRVGTIVEEPLVIHSVGTPAQRAREVSRLLERVGLPDGAEQRYPHEFSGGQRQRIAIARALALKPKVLVADEPVSALDVSVQAQIVNLLADLRDQLGLALVLISHDLRVIRWLTSSAMVLYLGRTVEAGPTARLLDAPIHPYTQLLSRSAPTLDGPSDFEDWPTLGEPPSPLAPPAGCAFHARCPFARASCAASVPPLVEHGDGVVACPVLSPGAPPSPPP